MHRRLLIRLSTAVGTLLLFTAPALSKGHPPTPCPGGHFLAAGVPALVGPDATLANRAIDIAGTQISLGGACPPIAGHLKASHKGTTVMAKWPACTGVHGSVRLKARIDAATCNTMTGTVKGKKFKRRFTATRAAPPICGNGVVEVGEPCDTSATPTGCPPGSGCIAQNNQCSCVSGCASRHASTDAIRGAVETALGQVADPWGNPKDFDQLFRSVETQLGCSLRDPLPAL